MYIEEDNLSFLNKLDTLLDPDKRAKGRFLKEFTIGLINASYKEKPINKDKIKIKITVADQVRCAALL